MTHTLTTERLKQIRNSFIAERDANADIGRPSLDEAIVIMDELLANREAQPVGYIGLPMLEQMRDGRQSGRIWSTPEDLGGSVPVFTAPPEPVVNQTFTGAPAVPDSVLILLNHIEDVLDDENWNRISVDKWNAVTMLAAAPEGGN